MKQINEITEDDLQAALQEQMRQHYETAHAKERQPGEFTLQEYMQVNGIDARGRGRAARILDQAVDAGEIVKREGGVEAGRACNFYKFTDAK